MKAKLPSLNGLRALSILFVLIGHTELKSLHLSGDPAGAQIGVTIFFIISGFLITYLLMREEQVSDGRVSLKDFYIRRAFRIFPVYYTLLLVYLILQVLGFLQFTTASWISSLTYTKYVNPRWSEWETGHLWSLSVEEQFYLVWPAVFYFLKRVRVPLAVAVIAVIPFVRLWGGYNAMHMFTRADALMGGCLLALYYDRLRGALAKLPRAYLLLPFAGLLGSMMTKRIITLFFHENTQVERIAIAFGGSYGTFTLLCVALILVVSINYTGNPWFRFLNASFMDYAGRLSYSIYIWQQMFYSPKLWPVSEFPGNIAFILVTAVLSYHLLETPFLKLKDRFHKRPKPAPVREFGLKTKADVV